MREDVIGPIAASLELIGVVAIVGGIVVASLGLLRELYGRWGAGSAIATMADTTKWDDLEEIFAPYRRNLLRVIVLGLTFLVAGDIVETASVDRTLGEVGTLGVIVLIREFLTVALSMETTGRWPWQPAPEDDGEPETGLGPAASSVAGWLARRGGEG